jgi:inorganic pyrophosphatase
VKSYADLPEILLQQIEHFFVHYKDLEKGKFVKSAGWVGTDEAARMITDGIVRAAGMK